MIIDIIAIIIIVICVATIFYVVAKKFSVLAAINIEALTKHKQDQIKKGLIEGRLVRKFKSMNVKKLFKDNVDEEKSDEKREPMLKRFYSQMKNLEKKYSEKIRVETPMDKVEQEKSITILLQEAEDLVDKEEFKFAEEKYIEIISLDEKSNEAYEGLGDVYFEMKDYEHAKEIYQYLLKINSQDDVALEHLGKIAVEEGKTEEATEDYLKSISLNNEVASYHVDLGDVYMATSEYKKALECYEEAVKLEPKNPRNLNAAISVAVKLKDFVMANKYYDQLREANPDNEKLDEIKEEIDSLKEEKK
ncbi:MAG: tetratricopeptide repeat protein [Candidatus Kerfeldbacteria bacterium]